MSPIQYQQRRKILWHPGGHSAIVDFGTRNKPDKQEVRWNVSRFMKMVGTNEYTNGQSWILRWEEEEVERFTSKVGLMEFLIRMAYPLEAGHLIPSEILYDAGLQYTDGWIDAWSELDNGEKTIIEIENPADLEPPKNRKIQMEPYIHIPRGTPQQSRPSARSYPHKIIHMDLEETEYVPQERIRFRDIGPEWEDPCPWYKKDYVRPRAELITKYHVEEDEGEELARRLQAVLAIHSSD